MSRSSAKQAHMEVANDSEPDALVDRLRHAALGKQSDTKNMRDAQMAFDTSLDFERRARLLAGFAVNDAPRRSEKNPLSKKGWLPVAMGIVMVIALGAALAKKTSQIHSAPAEANTVQAAELPQQERSAQPEQ